MSSENRSSMLKMKYQTYLLKHRNKVRSHTEGSAYSMKDSEKTKTYRAEWDFENRNLNVKKRLTEKEAEQFLKRVCKSKLWKEATGSLDGKPASECSGGTQPKLVWMKNMGSNTRIVGRASKTVIYLSPNRPNKYTILHELAHVAGYMNHGRGFRIMLIRLVSRFLGRDMAAELKQAFKRKGLKVSKVRAAMDYDQWKERYLRNEARREGGFL